MTQIISDIRILDNLLALNLDISLWSARKKMTVEDFGGAELPPEDLASLGSKRIADPSSLKIFSTLKARAFSFLDRHGVRFMSGWAIPEEKAGAIIQELVVIRDEFLREKEARVLHKECYNGILQLRSSLCNTLKREYHGKRFDPPARSCLSSQGQSCAHPPCPESHRRKFDRFRSGCVAQKG